MPRLFLSVLFVGLCSISFSQTNDSAEKLTHEVLFQTDNDYLVPNLESDKNYTYGLFLGYRLRSDSAKAFIFSKKASHYIHSFELGLEGYTPEYEAKNFDPYNSNDRPFAGWLYGEYRQIYIFKKAFFSVGLQVGTMGSDAHAGEIQNEFHAATGFEYVPGWETQVPDFIGVNLIGHYENIFYKREHSFFYYRGATSIGTVFTNIDNRIGLAFGYNPTLFGFTRLHNDSDKNSFFAQVNAGINYTYHDATLEGNPFAKNKFLNDKEFDNSTIVIAFKIHYLLNKWAFVYSGTYESEAVYGSDSHRFGRITILKAF